MNIKRGSVMIKMDDHLFGLQKIHIPFPAGIWPDDLEHLPGKESNSYDPDYSGEYVFGGFHIKA